MPAGHMQAGERLGAAGCFEQIASKRCGVIAPARSRWVAAAAGSVRPSRDPLARQKSCASSSTQHRRRPSMATPAAPGHAGAERPTRTALRWQKPWMVKIEASSKVCSATCSRFAHVARRPARGRAARSSRPATKGSCAMRAAVQAVASVSTRRARMRSRSSAVAALVKVTTSTCASASPRSSSRRSTRAHRFQVLPVPAEASISVVPSSGPLKTSSSRALTAGAPAAARIPPRPVRQSARRPAVPAAPRRA
jgi:hypothetical protein